MDGNGNNNNYINGINIINVPRLPYRALNEISYQTGSRINPRVYNPRENRRHYGMNSYALFNCNRCGNKWSSNKVTVELWWDKGKWEFDVRMYGQKCKSCDGQFLIPHIVDLQTIKDKCVKVLTTNDNNGERINTNKNTNRNFNDSHDQKRCQKCIMIGHACW